jgi:hypothetical protein
MFLNYDIVLYCMLFVGSAVAGQQIRLLLLALSLMQHSAAAFTVVGFALNIVHLRQSKLISLTIRGEIREQFYLVYSV